MLGVCVNFIAIVIGATFGLVLNKEVPKSLQKSLMNALALGVIYIGILGLSAPTDTLFIIVSLVLGTFIGELLRIDENIHQQTLKLEAKLQKGDIAEGFISAVLLFCVGAMAILGAVESSQGNHDIFYTKAVLDGVTSVMFATTLGLGVLLSAFVVLIYQGSLVLLAGLLSPILTEAALTDIGVLGGLMMLALGLNVMGITKIKVANMLPALVLPILWHLI